MSNRFNLDGFGALGILGGLASLGWALYQSHKLQKTSEKLDMTLETLAKKTNVEVEQSVVDKAIDMAVERRVAKATNEAVAKVRQDVQEEISKAVRKEVDDQYKHISEDVADKISEQVANIDEAAFQKKVLDRAEDKVYKKVEEGVNSIISEARKKTNSKLDSELATWDAFSGLVQKHLYGSRSGEGRGIRIVSD